MLTTRSVIAMTWASIMLLAAGVVSGQDPSTELRTGYPDKPIRIFAPGVGGSGDLTARLIAPGMSDRYGQPVIVENRPGIIPTETVMKAAADGYTLLVQGNAMWIGPLVQKANYDPVGDFTPISLLQTYPSVLVVHPSLPVKSVKELIALAKARPGELNYGTSGIGGPPHLAAELLKSMAGINIVRINYKGVGETMAALVSGEVQVAFTNLSAAIAHIKSGRLRALAVNSAQPSALAPGLPTVAATGLPGYEVGNMTGILAPVKTPAGIINRLNQDIVRVLNQADVKQKFLNAGIEIVGSSPEEFAAAIKSDMARMGKVIKDAGIRID